MKIEIREKTLIQGRQDMFLVCKTYMKDVFFLKEPNLCSKVQWISSNIGKRKSIWQTTADIWEGSRSFVEDEPCERNCEYNWLGKIKRELWVSFFNQALISKVHWGKTKIWCKIC